MDDGWDDPEASAESSGGRDTVVFVSVSRGLGGPGRSLLTVLDHLDDQVRPVLFAPDGDVTRLGRRRRGVEVVAMPRATRFRRSSRIRAAVALARYVREHRGRILALHANGQSELNVCALAMLVARRPVVMWAHTSVASPTAAILRPLWRRASRVRWLAVSEVAGEVLAETVGADPARIEVIENPIDPADVVAPEREDAERGRSEREDAEPCPSEREGPERGRSARESPELGRSARGADGSALAEQAEGRATVRVAYLGLALPHKGFDLLAPIARYLDDPDIGLDLYVAPPVPETPVHLRAPWEDLDAASKVHDVTLPGRVADVRRIYAASDIVLCPSRKESFGRIAAEAMLNGLPVVASDIPAFRDLVGASGGGLLFPVDDVEAAAAALRELATDPALRWELGERGRAYAERFTPSRIVPRLAAVYREVG